MESVDANDMDDLFGPDEAIEDNSYDNDGNKRKVEKKVDDIRTVKVKNINRAPRPKLDADRLISDKGIPKVLKSFENVKFKGKGNEKEDLDTLLSVMEHWGHRMYPQLPFKDLVEKVEKLGSKRTVQVCLGKMRMDMPVTEEDFVSRHDEFDDKPNGNFDLLMNEHNLQSSEQPATNPEQIQPKKPTLSEEQRERIARNRKIAEEKMKARRNAKIVNEPPESIDKNEPVDNSENCAKFGEKSETELMSMLDDV